MNIVDSIEFHQMVYKKLNCFFANLKDSDLFFQIGIILLKRETFKLTNYKGNGNSPFFSVGLKEASSNTP